MAATRSPPLARSFNQMAGELSQPYARARDRGRHTPAAAGRCLARADDAADGDARISRDAVDVRDSRSTRRPVSAICRSCRRKRIVSSESSEICSTWRGSKAAARRCGRNGSRVAALFDRVAARHERELRQRNVRLEFHVNAGAEHVIGDPDRLEQALQNLAANALRHTPDGGQITLTSGFRCAGAGVRPRSVRDTGPGIPAGSSAR